MYQQQGYNRHVQNNQNNNLLNFSNGLRSLMQICYSGLSLITFGSQFVSLLSNFLKGFFSFIGNNFQSLINMNIWKQIAFLFSKDNFIGQLKAMKDNKYILYLRIFMVLGLNLFMLGYILMSFFNRYILQNNDKPNKIEPKQEEQNNQEVYSSYVPSSEEFWKQPNEKKSLVNDIITQSQNQRNNLIKEVKISKPWRK